MYCQEATHCCAINEFEGLNECGFTAKEAIRTIAQTFFDEYREEDAPLFAHVVMFQKYGSMTNVETGCANLTELAKYIKDHKLGTLTIGVTKRNPNSGNMVKPAIFTPSISGMERWASKNGISTESRGYDDYDDRW